MTITYAPRPSAAPRAGGEVAAVGSVGDGTARDGRSYRSVAEVPTGRGAC